MALPVVHVAPAAATPAPSPIPLPPTKECVKRLKQEWQEIVQSPPDYIIACPHPNNLLEWHFVIMGPEDSPYEGGTYHGSLKFKHDYPLSPPSVSKYYHTIRGNYIDITNIYMHTPSGRFEINTRLCLSISDFHPETWTPTWSVSSILVGLLSFMLDNEITYGSIKTSKEEREKLAKESHAFNKKDSIFCEVFPFMVDDASV